MVAERARKEAEEVRSWPGHASPRAARPFAVPRVVSAAVSTSACAWPQRDARKARFQRALDQANEASRALKPTSSLAPAAPDADGVADEDEELQASLERARLAAQKAGRAQESLAGVARSLVANREQEENAGPVTAGGVVFTDAVEFLR